MIFACVFHLVHLSSNLKISDMPPATWNSSPLCKIVRSSCRVSVGCCRSRSNVTSHSVSSIYMPEDAV